MRDCNELQEGRQKRKNGTERWKIRDGRCGSVRDGGVEENDGRQRQKKRQTEK